MPARVRVRVGDVDVDLEIRDVSRRGLFILIDRPPPVGSELSLVLLAEDGEAFGQALGRVVWVQPAVGVGVELVELSRGDVQLSEVLDEALSAPREPGARVATRIRGKGAADVVTIGIDLGTSNTCAAALVGGKPKVIPTRYGTNTIPSVVAWDHAGRIQVGHAAARRMILHPEETLYGSKRLIGRAFSEEVAEEYQPHFAYPIVEVDGAFGAKLAGGVMSMEEAATHILKEVKQVAEQHVGTMADRAVITVPAYFTDVQREAVRRAGREAGLQVARIVPEPTAAAVAYGHGRSEEVTLAVFDLGGGTFDFSLLEVAGGTFTVIGSGGDNFLGGIDVDDRLASHMLDEFMKAERVDLAPTAQQLARLREAAEDAKRGLSVQKRFAVLLPQFAEVGGELRDLRASIDRELLETIAGDLVERALEIAADVMAICGVEPHAVGDVLLVGGMTRVPLVQEEVERFFGRRPSRRINPDEAVAVGAGLLAKESLDVELVDALPISIGTAGDGRRLLRLLPRHTRVPAERSFVVATRHDDQIEYTVPLFQGEMPDAAANEYLGTVVLRNIPPGPAGSHRFELTLALDAECMLQVRAIEARSGISVPVEVDRARSLSRVVAELGPYDGPELPSSPRQKPRWALARLFSKLTFWKRG